MKKVLKLLFLLPLALSISSCKVKEGHVHHYDNWTTTKEATCLDKGEEKAICSECGNETTRSIPSLGHDITDWTYTITPTCTTSGMEERHCTRCDKKEERFVEVLGHLYSDYVTTIEPTCEKDGKKIKTCSRCQDVQEVTLPKLGHLEFISKKAKDATCDDDGWTEEIKCSRCNNILTPSTTIAAMGHNYAITYVWNEDATQCVATAICKNNSNEVITETANAVQTITLNPTCTQNGAARYDATFNNAVFKKQSVNTTVLALGHDSVKLSIVPSTCTVPGNVNYHCNRCNENYSEVLPLEEHTLVTEIPEKKATCEEDGYTAKITCAVCKQLLQESTKIKALGHDFKVSGQTESSCTTGGTITQTCSRCQKTKVISLETKAHVDSDNDSFCDNCYYFMYSDSATKIYNSQDLTKIRLNDKNAYYVLANDIEVNGFVPLGDENNSFDGILYGNHHTITFNGYNNMSLCGIFYRVKGKIVSLNINPNSFSTLNTDCKVGFIALYNSGTIKDCNITSDRTYSFKTSYTVPNNGPQAISRANTFEVGELVYTNEANGNILNCKLDGKITMKSDTDSHYYHGWIFADFHICGPYQEQEEHLYVTMTQNFACIAVNNSGNIANCDISSTLTHTGQYLIGTGYSRFGYGYFTFTINQSIASIVTNNTGLINNTIASKFSKPTVSVEYSDKKSTHNKLSENYIFNSVYGGMITNNSGNPNISAY